jgi:hypothetical protein
MGRLCSNRSHLPDREPLFYPEGSAFPRLLVWRKTRRNQPAMYFVGYGWDAPILKIDLTTVPGLSDIQGALSKLVEGVLMGRKVCPHLYSNTVEEFVKTSICECFANATTYTKDAGLDACNCERVKVLKCELCSAKMGWWHHRNTIILRYRHGNPVVKPASDSWLNLFGRQHIRKICTKEFKHVLWCDTPDCWTAQSNLWYHMVKDPECWSS